MHKPKPRVETFIVDEIVPSGGRGTVTRKKRKVVVDGKTFHLARMEHLRRIGREDLL